MRTHFLEALRQLRPGTWLAISLCGIPLAQGLAPLQLEAAPPVVISWESADSALTIDAGDSTVPAITLVAQAPVGPRTQLRDANPGPWIPMKPGEVPAPGMMGPGRAPMRPGNAPAMRAPMARAPMARPDNGPTPQRGGRGPEPEQRPAGEAKPEARRESGERREPVERRESVERREPMSDRQTMPGREPGEPRGAAPGGLMPPVHAPMWGPMAGHPMTPMPSPGIHPGGDNFEQHLHALERFFDSPFIRRHLELIAENTHLKAQLEMQERLHMQQRERQPDRAAQERAERERAERERAERERAERGRSESAQREARGGNEAEKLRDQVAQLEGQLQDMRAASEKAQRAIIEMTEQREQWMRKMHAEMEQRMQEALRRAGVDGKPRESSGDRPKRKEAD